MAHEDDFHRIEEHLHLIHNSQHALSRSLAELFHLVRTQGDAQMAISAELVAAIAAIDTATNDVAKRIADLSAQITTQMTPDDVASVVAQLNTEASKLEGIAANPAQPVPAAPAA